MTPNPQAIRKGGVFSAVGESDSPQTNADKRASTAAQILLEHLKPILEEMKATREFNAKLKEMGILAEIEFEEE